MNAFDADLLILGGGCAGLSLATRLATRCPALKVIVVEPRTHYVADRTWCGWRTAPHPYFHCVAADWTQWRLKHGTNTLQRGSKMFPYEMISAAMFYEQSCAKIHASALVRLQMGVSAVSVREDRDGVMVCLGNGQNLRARWVIDTRPQTRALRFPALWQNFVGYEIQADQGWTDRLGSTPVLMDFQPAGSAVLQFMYLLPLGNHRFLCEWTRFSSTHGESNEIEVELHGWLTSRGYKEGMFGRRESGSLPMSTVPTPNQESRIVAAGTSGGSMRASTGYAFHSIQRWADRCADALAAGKPPISPARNPLLDFLDNVFLTALQDRTIPAETIFMKLFEQTKPDSLVRFLSGTPQPGDILPVMASLPWVHFSKASIKTMLRSGAA